MKTSVNRWQVVFIVATIVCSVSMAEGSRREAILAAQNLSAQTYSMARYARMRGYPNTSVGLRQIARLADRAEMAARFQTRAEAGQVVNRIIMEYLNVKQFMANIPSLRDRVTMKRTVRDAINRLGFAVFGNGFPVVRAPVVTDEASAERVLDSNISEGTLDSSDWATDAGPLPGPGGGVLPDDDDELPPGPVTPGSGGDGWE